MIRTLTAVNEQTLAEIQEEKGIRKTDEVFLLFPLGSQFDHLIKMKMEELGVFCVVADPSTLKAEDVAKVNPKGIILSGGPVSVYHDPPPFDAKIFDLGIPVLGICLGFQLWAQHVGCRVFPAHKREFGKHTFVVRSDSPLFAGCPSKMKVLQSHGDTVDPIQETYDKGFRLLGRTKHTPFAAAQFGHLWGVQFHPEVTATAHGQQMFENFCFTICGAKDRYPAEEVAEQKIEELTQRIGDMDVLLALSGGSDSSTVAYLLGRAVCDSDRLYARKHLHGVYIKGIDRPEDEVHVRDFFGGESWIDLHIVDATDKFLAALKGVTKSREKRMAVRKVYKDVLEQYRLRLDASFVAQGTLYTDISESGHGHAVAGVRKAEIKVHHNVGLDFSVPELMPLGDQVKDTGRNIGRAIGVPEVLLTRHPFPGPGFVVRIEGEVTPEKLHGARILDGIFMEEIHRAGLYEKIWQAGVTITSSVASCSKGDDATSGWVVCMWAFHSVNGFTAEPVRLPWEVIERASQRMTNEVRQVARVTYNCTGKPPGTIEWE